MIVTDREKESRKSVLAARLDDDDDDEIYKDAVKSWEAGILKKEY